eukprot:4930241-Pleurochrysis_carterae.AAC.3
MHVRRRAPAPVGTPPADEVRTLDGAGPSCCLGVQEAVLAESCASWVKEDDVGWAQRCRPRVVRGGEFAVAAVQLRAMSPHPPHPS